MGKRIHLSYLPFIISLLCVFKCLCIQGASLEGSQHSIFFLLLKVPFFVALGLNPEPCACWEKSLPLSYIPSPKFIKKEKENIVQIYTVYDV
jgi:hypothetical protein